MPLLRTALLLGLVATGALTGCREMRPPQPKGEPIPAGREAITQRSFDQVNLNWCLRVMLDEYRRQPRPDEAGGLFVERALHHLAGTPGAPWQQQLVAEARALGAAAQEPLVALLAGLVETDLAQAQAHLSRAAIELPRTGYPPFLQFMAASNLAKNGSDCRVPAAEQTRLDRAALEALRTSLAGTPFRSTDLYALSWRLHAPSVENLSDRCGAELCEILARAPGLPAWLRDQMLGDQALREAWAARGGGTAGTVTRAGWTGFEDGLKRARSLLTSSWTANPQHPYAPTRMIAVTMGENETNDSMRRWFDRAVAAQADYPAAYRAYRYGMLPRWHGTHEQILQFGDECRAIDRFDTLIPLQYVSALIDIAEDRRDDGYLARSPQYDHAQQILERYAIHPNAPFTKPYARTYAAILAFRAGKPAEARRYLGDIQNKPDPILSWLQDIPAMMRKLSMKAE